MTEAHLDGLHGWLHGVRTRINGFVSAHLVAWELSMAALAFLYLAIGFMEDHPDQILNLNTLTPVEYAITVIFLAEFSIRIFAAPSRRGYLKSHWIDLLALLPSIRWLRFLRLGRVASLLRLARILRLGMLVRLLTELDRFGNSVRWIAVRNGVHIILTLAVGLVVISGTLVYELEHTINPAYHNFEDAIWWAFATMSTVGYGNGPITLAGRAIAGIVMIVGIACFGLITATVTAHFVHPHIESHETNTDEVLALLEDIRTRLARLEEERIQGSSLGLDSDQNMRLSDAQHLAAQKNL